MVKLIYKVSSIRTDYTRAERTNMVELDRVFNRTDETLTRYKENSFTIKITNIPYEINNQSSECETADILGTKSMAFY